MSGFEYPHSESLRPEHPLEGKRVESLKIVDLEFTEDESGVFFRKKFNDDSVSEWQQTEVAPNDPVKAQKMKERKLHEYGLLKEDKEVA